MEVLLVLRLCCNCTYGNYGIICIDLGNLERFSYFLSFYYELGFVDSVDGRLHLSVIMCLL